jgi:hypothetical protein
MKTCVPADPDVALIPSVLSKGGVGVTGFGSIFEADAKLLAATNLNPIKAPIPPMTTITRIEQTILKTNPLHPLDRLFMKESPSFFSLTCSIWKSG